MAFDLWNLTQDARRNTGNADIQCASSAHVRTAADRTIPALPQNHPGRTEATVRDALREFGPITGRDTRRHPGVGTHRRAPATLVRPANPAHPRGGAESGRRNRAHRRERRAHRPVRRSTNLATDNGVPEPLTVGRKPGPARTDDRRNRRQTPRREERVRPTVGSARERNTGTPEHRTRRDRAATSTTGTDQSRPGIPQTRENNSKTGTKTRDRVATASQRWAGHKVQTSTPEKQTEQQRPAATPKEHETQFDR